MIERIDLDDIESSAADDEPGPNRGDWLWRGEGARGDWL